MSYATHVFLPASTSIPAQPAQFPGPSWGDKKRGLQRLEAIRASLRSDVTFVMLSMSQVIIPRDDGNGLKVEPCF